MITATQDIPTRPVHVRRFSVTSSRDFDGIVRQLEAALGHPDVTAFTRGMAAAGSIEDLERLVQKAVGPSGLMEFARFNIGEVLRKERPGWPRTLRLVIGNPLIMKQMVVHVPDAASYVPVTILIDERADGVHLSYDLIASLLAPYGSPEALEVAQELDFKIESLLTAAAAQEAA